MALWWWYNMQLWHWDELYAKIVGTAWYSWSYGICIRFIEWWNLQTRITMLGILPLYMSSLSLSVHMQRCKRYIHLEQTWSMVECQHIFALHMIVIVIISSFQKYINVQTISDILDSLCFSWSYNSTQLCISDITSLCFAYKVIS